MTRARLVLAGAALLCAASACIAPSVVAPEQRSIDLDAADVAWAPATADDLAGTFVSTELTGDLAVALRKLVYCFGADGAYTGAALLDDAPPHFEVLSGTWSLDAGGLRLDGGPAAVLEVAPDGSLRLSGAEGRVVLRRELAR